MEQRWQIIPKLFVFDFGTYTYTHTHMHISLTQLCLSGFLCLGRLATVVCLTRSTHPL